MTLLHLDRDELEMAFAYLVGALPDPPRWVALVSVDGHCLGQYLNQHDDVQVADVMVGMKGSVDRLLHQTGNGELRYSINVGSEGVVLVLLLGDTHWVGINVPHGKSLDRVLQGVNEGLTPLMDFLDGTYGSY